MSENSTNELLIRMEEKYKKMSKGQKRLADYVTENYDKAVFLTAARLGEVVGVSESTVVRFATQLGYKGYPGFQKALEELVRNKLNSIQRMGLFLIIRAERRLIEADQRISPWMSANDEKSLNRCRRSH